MTLFRGETSIRGEITRVEGCRNTVVISIKYELGGQQQGMETVLIEILFKT